MMNTAVKPESMLMALYLCVAPWLYPFYIDRQSNKHKPCEAADPVPTKTKKLSHCSIIDFDPTTS